MTYRNFLAIAAILALVLGLAMVFLPTQTFALYGVELNAAGAYAVQLFGATSLAIAVLNWLGREVREAAGRQAILAGNLTGFSAGFVISLIAKLVGETGANNWGWSTIIIYFLMVVGFAYIQFISKETRAPTKTTRSRR